MRKIKISKKVQLRHLVNEMESYIYPPMDFRDWDTRSDVLGIMSDMITAGATKVKPLYKKAVAKQIVNKRTIEKAIKLSEERLKK